MVFFWEAGGSPPLYRLSGSRPFGLLSFPRLPSSSLFRLHSITRVTPPLLPLSLHQNSTSTRNDCIVDVDTNNVSGTVDKTALLFLLSARSSFPFDSLGQGSRVAQRGQESAGGKASELLRNASFGENRSVVVSMGGEEEEAWQSGLGIAEGGRLESWKRVGQSARLTYARCKFLSIVRYDVRWLALAARSSFDFGVVSIRPRRGIELRVVWKSSRGLI